MSNRQRPKARGAYKIFIPVTTRWADNDVYGHINNVAYYSFFDTAVNQYLIENNALNIETAGAIGLVVATDCVYHKPLSYPDKLEVGISVSHLGKSSVTYDIGIFKQGDITSSADGHFTHVYVDRENRRPMDISGALKDAVQSLAAN
jgi:acyl-CoA thioester hydrolase